MESDKELDFPASAVFREPVFIDYKTSSLFSAPISRRVKSLKSKKKTKPVDPHILDLEAHVLALELEIKKIRTDAAAPANREKNSAKKIKLPGAPGLTADDLS